MAGKEVILGVTGGISAYKSCEVVRALKKLGHQVTVVMTPEACRFVTPLTMRTLSGRPVVTDMFEENFVWDPAHIALAEKADLVAVVPATANIIAKLAVGLCDDILSCIILATRATRLICPAMNDNMYAHPSVRANLDKIKEYGYSVLEPEDGLLASGKSGKGRLPEPETVVKAIQSLLGA